MKLLNLVFVATISLLAEPWEKLPDGSAGQPMQVKARDGANLAAYVRKPDGPGPFPVVVLIHGGAGSVGTTNELGRRLASPTADLVAAGWVVFSADFRAQADGPNPANAIEDA